jgi:hypothetical protein
MSSEKALERAKEEVAKLKSRLSSTRERADEESAELQGIAVEGASAYLFGSYKASEARSSRTLMTVGGLPPELVWGGVAYAAGRYMGGRSGEILASGGRGVLVGHAMQKGIENGSRP